MEDMPHDDTVFTVDLSYEWQRVTTLISLTEMVRAGMALPENFEPEFITLLDLDILAAVLAPFANPTLGPRLQAVQPFLNLPYPALPLVQEFLMLDSAAEFAELMAHLAPTAPLIAGNIVRLKQQGEYLVLKPSAQTVRAILNRPAELGPPPGASLDDCPHGWEALVLPARVISRL